MSKRLVFVVLICGALPAHAACPSWPTAERFAFNGAEVTDQRTGLTWKRCSEGQTWSGSACIGSATTHTHEQALALAKAAVGWRLPHIKELASLADKGCRSPTIDANAFSATPANFFWSSSPNVGGSYDAWGVDFSYGGLLGYGMNRPSGGAVRLVRASQ